MVTAVVMKIYFREKAELTQACLIPQIVVLNYNFTTPKFDGGVKFLVQWFRSKVNSY